MTTLSNATFQITGWDENPVDDKTVVSHKLTKAHVTCTFEGDIEGEGIAEYLMVYPTDEKASFVGLQQIKGSVRGNKGTVVLEVFGTFENGIAKAEWSVADDSGTDELKGISGKGGYESKSDGTADATFNYNM
jgi:hypothetical protein